MGKGIFYTDIKDKKEFTFEDTTLVQKEYCEETGRYLYHRLWKTNCAPEKVGTLMGYEVVKPKKRKQPDGTYVHMYPSSDDFGTYGWFFPANTKREELDDCLHERGRWKR